VGAGQPEYTQINAVSLIADANSIYHYTREMIALRHSDPAFVYGEYQDLNPSQEHVFVYTRTLGESRFLVVLNFSKQQTEYTLPPTIKAGKLRLGNYPTADDKMGATTLHLRPWEARVYQQ
jgi:oligo-1,6-glucosidase